MPAITVGIPFRNAEATITDAIRSVFSQTFDDWELILVDDGSTDESLNLVRQIRDRRVRVLSDRTNQGLARRLNQIARIAQGELLARMDADDLMHPTRLERQYRFMIENPTVDVVGTAAYVIDSSGRLTGIRGQEQFSQEPRSVLTSGLFLHPTVLGKTDWFRANPYRDSLRRSQDYELWCRSCATSQFRRIPEPLYYYREGGEVSGLQRYIASCAVQRVIIKEYGPNIVGDFATTMLRARVTAKEWVYRVAASLGLEQMLIRRRSTPLLESQRRAAADGLSAIEAVRLPGLSEEEVDDSR